MKNWLTRREEILETPVPENTKTYTAIPHSVFLNEIAEELDKKNYRIAEERFLTGDQNRIITGNFRIDSGYDSEMMPAITFTNSYNKTRRASLRASALVLVCKNGAIAAVENGSYVRKHTTNALVDFRGKLSMVVSGLEKEFERLVTNKEEMKQIELDSKTRALLVGDMLINEQLVTSTQLNILTREIQGSKDFQGNSLWSFYNHVTEAFKDSHPMFYDKQHVKFHTYISDKFDLTGARGLYGEPIIMN